MTSHPGVALNLWGALLDIGAAVRVVIHRLWSDEVIDVLGHILGDVACEGRFLTLVGVADPPWMVRWVIDVGCGAKWTNCCAWSWCCCCCGGGDVIPWLLAVITTQTLRCRKSKQFNIKATTLSTVSCQIWNQYESLMSTPNTHLARKLTSLSVNLRF